MTFIDTHCQDCIKELGEPFEHVHKWIDGVEPPYDTKKPDPRHHRGGVEYIRRSWGDKAARAAELHILRDTGGRIPTESEARAWGMGGCGVKNETVKTRAD